MPRPSSISGPGKFLFNSPFFVAPSSHSPPLFLLSSQCKTSIWRKKKKQRRKLKAKSGIPPRLEAGVGKTYGEMGVVAKLNVPTSPSRFIPSSRLLHFLLIQRFFSLAFEAWDDSQSFYYRKCPSFGQHGGKVFCPLRALRERRKNPSYFWQERGAKIPNTSSFRTAHFLLFSPFPNLETDLIETAQEKGKRGLRLKQEEEGKLLPF